MRNAASITAETYLKTKPPYFGDSSFEDKDILKEAGGVWDKLAKKWAAKTTNDFVSLVETGRWFPAGLPADQLQLACQIIRRSERETLERELQSRTLSKAPVLSEKDQERVRRDRDGISNDTPEQLARLADLGISKELVRPAMVHKGLGPYSGQSDAFRLLRGLRYNIITVEQVRSGKFSADNHAESEATRCARASRTQRVRHQEFLHSPASQDPTDPVQLTDAKDTTHTQCWMDPNYTHLVMECPETYCEKCRQLVTDQFMDCACSRGENRSLKLNRLPTSSE
tara:strand:+ start:3402 stop:4253 length:852 start_codon:yes stop_codon:yes gene_type:complete